VRDWRKFVARRDANHAPLTPAFASSGSNSDGSQSGAPQEHVLDAAKAGVEKVGRFPNQ
jgi:hypothetical protein